MKADIQKKYLMVIIAQLFIASHALTQEQVFYRSEYEQAGDQIGDVDLPGEGTYDYVILEGNDAGHYSIDASGKIWVNAIIADVPNEVTAHDLTIQCHTDQISIRIMDAYDHMLEQYSGYTILEAHKENYILPGNPYSGYNNLWGRGTAQEGVDFRMATLCDPDMPDETIFVWDTPSSAKDYGGASVWCYISVLWGNRKGYRDDLTGFPFQISSIHSMFIDFDFEKLYGTEGYKIALNHFLTNESYLDNFSSNDGDFFLVFDQKGTWIPPYPVSLSDTVINNKDFARLYKEEDGYEWRRVIIKDNQRLLNGTIDMKGIYDSFITRGYLNASQYIPNIQVGLEVTDGFGALRLNSWAIRLNESPLNVEEKQFATIRVVPNPSMGFFRSSSDAPWQIYSMNGRLLCKGHTTDIDLSDYPDGLYILKQSDEMIKLIKR
ncbi:T9SS type A sorting domain-containing protein [Carboxylicivirga sp. RSCT41]|uniref:T9SS type A sorting domain-containing protein n=1 Tax=Carboxylicivirga agarovorans TaxID=3417570 RepID=UPI003D32C407